MLTAIPEGPVTLDQATQEEQAKTGYVISVNGKQGAVAGLAPLKSPAFTGSPTLNGSPLTGGGSPPLGTPDFAAPMAVSGVAAWKHREDFLADLFAGRAFFVDAEAVSGVDDQVPIQAAIDAAETAGGGTVNLAGLPAYSISAPIVPKGGVTIYSGRQATPLLGATGPTITAASTFTGAYMVDHGATLLDSWALVGVNLVGRGAIATALGGVRVGPSHNVRVVNCSIGGMSDSAVLLDSAAVGTQVHMNVMQYLVTARTLTQPVGVLHIANGATDFDIGWNEINGGPSHTGGPSNGYDRVSYPGDFYRCGIYVGGAVGRIGVSGLCVAEFCDVGYYIDGNNNIFGPGARSDYSAGHGWYDRGHDNVFNWVQTNACGLATTYDSLVYHGAVVTGPAQREHWYFNYENGGAAIMCGYGWRDETTGLAQKDRNVLHDWSIKPEDCFYDVVYCAEPRTALLRGGAGPARDRPPSRLANGQTWVDTDTGALTYSDGTVWRNLMGDVVGNLATARLAEGIGGVLQVITADTTCTASGALWVNASTAGRLLGTGVMTAVVCTAAGATAGYMNVIAAGDLAGHHTAVVAGSTYTFTLRTVGETHAATLSLVVNWFDVSHTYIGSTSPLAASSGGTNSTSAVTDTVWNGVLAPAGAAHAEPAWRFTRAGMAAGEAYWLNCVGICLDPASVVTAYVKP